MATDLVNEIEVPELLYHVKRTIIDFGQDRLGATQTTDIFSTFTDLATAKDAARSILWSEGYTHEDFVKYEENDSKGEWKHGDGVIVSAKAPSGQQFEVVLDTNPNVLQFKGSSSDKVEGNLYYVLQNTIYNNNGNIGGIQTTEIEGTYPDRKAALEAAKNAMLDEDVTKDSFAEYEEKDIEGDQWPYGDDVLIHAVAETGEHFRISVKAQPHSHQYHKCGHHGDSECDCLCNHTEHGCKHKECKHEECDSSKELAIR